MRLLNGVGGVVKTPSQSKRGKPRQKCVCVVVNSLAKKLRNYTYISFSFFLLLNVLYKESTIDKFRA